VIYIVPSRGRPKNIARLITAFEQTRTVGGAELFIVVDDDDPRVHDYRAVIKDGPVWVNWVRFKAPRRPAMVDALNYASRLFALQHDVIGFMGDDHLPRTRGWDEIMRAAATDQLAYGNDTIHGQNLPTQVAMPARFVKALGYMAPPTFRHLYVDNYWYALGQRVGITYLPAVIIEHMHPIAGRAQWDDTYKMANDGALYEADKLTYEELRASGRIDADAQKCLAVK
jgi:hypothetical protein